MSAVYWSTWLLLGTIIGIIISMISGQWLCLPLAYAGSILFGFMLHPGAKQ